MDDLEKRKEVRRKFVAALDSVAKLFKEVDCYDIQSEYSLKILDLIDISLNNGSACFKFLTNFFKFFPLLLVMLTA